MNQEDMFGHRVDPNPGAGALAKEFLIPPFTVLNAREGWWQGRKAAWLALGIESELGRGGADAEGDAKTYNSGKPGDLSASLKQTASLKGGLTVGMTMDAYRKEGEDADDAANAGTSIFDPVLCELAYRWFCPPGGVVLDPFAGGSVRGVVAAVLGMKYHGVELRAEQVAANREQGQDICPKNPPQWHIGDSRHAGLLLPDGFGADFLFTCPPYGDLERYSDDPRDLSTMDYADFRAGYDEVIRAACRLLKPDRFACVVVGDFRGKDGAYRSFPAHTVEAFERCGLKYYNEAVLVTAVGSLPVRTGKQFRLGRKLGKSHQNVIVMCKGDWRKAGAACNADTPPPAQEAA